MFFNYVFNTNIVEKYADWNEYMYERDKIEDMDATMLLCKVGISKPGLHKACVSYGWVRDCACDNFKSDVPCEKKCYLRRKNNEYVDSYNAHAGQKKLVKNFWGARMALRQKYLSNVGAPVRRGDLIEYKALQASLDETLGKLRHMAAELELKDKEPNSNTQFIRLLREYENNYKSVIYFWGKRMAERVK